MGQRVRRDCGECRPSASPLHAGFGAQRATDVEGIDQGVVERARGHSARPRTSTMVCVPVLRPGRPPVSVQHGLRRCLDVHQAQAGVEGPGEPAADQCNRFAPGGPTPAIHPRTLGSLRAGDAAPAGSRGSATSRIAPPGRRLARRLATAPSGSATWWSTRRALSPGRESPGLDRAGEDAPGAARVFGVRAPTRETSRS